MSVFLSSRRCSLRVRSAGSFSESADLSRQYEMGIKSMGVVRRRKGGIVADRLEKPIQHPKKIVRLNSSISRNEESTLSSNFKYVIGVDEAGRGNYSYIHPETTSTCVD